MKTLSQRDQSCIWHPFTQHQGAQAPIALVRGAGACLYDESGNEYIDAIASWWMNLHGHAHPYLAERLAQQAQTLEHAIFAEFTHRPAVELAERLLQHAPHLQRVFYSDNGSTATEIAVKMCFQYWYNRGTPKTKLIALEGAYHGDTFGAMSFGGRSIFSQPFAPFLFDVLFIEAPLPGREAASLAQLDALLQGNDIAGIIVEPLVQGAGGMRMYRPEALEAIWARCRQAGVLCIADEVMTGFGRTGTFFACDQAATKPDIYCLSKGLTGGTMALGATLCTEEIFQAFCAEERWKTFFHGHSCTGNPLACSVALASLDLLETPERQADIERIADRHRQFAARLQGFPHLSNIRQTGVILAFDIHTQTQTANSRPLRDAIWSFVLQRRLILRPLGNTVYVLPPYCITDAQLDRVYAGIEALAEYLQGEKWGEEWTVC